MHLTLTLAQTHVAIKLAPTSPAQQQCGNQASLHGVHPKTQQRVLGQKAAAELQRCRDVCAVGWGGVRAAGHENIGKSHVPGSV